MGETRVGSSRDGNARNRVGGRQGPLSSPPCSSPRKPAEEPASRSRAPALPSPWRDKLPAKDGAGVRSPWPQTSATPPTLRSQIPSAPGLRSQDGETLEGDRDLPEGDPDAAGEILGPRREAATGCRDAALAAVQRRRPFPWGRGVPAPPRVQLLSEVPLPQDLLSLAVCARAEGGADRWASASAASAAVRGGDPAGGAGGRAGTRREVRGGRACGTVLGAQHAGRRTPA